MSDSHDTPSPGRPDPVSGSKEPMLRPDYSPEALLERLAGLESNLKSVKREVDQSSHLATLGLLSATIAHELRNILTPVLSYAQLARTRMDDERLVRKALDKAVSGVEAAAEVLESTLDFACGTPHAADPASADIGAVLKNALKCLARTPGRDGIEMEVEIPESMRVRMRPLSLQQVFMNLILNAQKALSGRGRNGERAVIRISARRATGGEAVEIEIADNGPGLPPAIADHVFEPFISSSPRLQPGDGSGSPGSESTGTGLGLTICKRLVDSATGRIHVESSQQGTTFTLLLPADHAAACELRKAG